MKKHTLLKAISIAFLVYVVLTWIIPTGYFSTGEYVKDAITPIGLFDIIRYPLITLTSSVFILTGLVILLIGALYGVLNKTGAYQSFVDSVVKKFKTKEKTFLIITLITFLLLSSLTTLNLPLLIMVPFFATVLLLLGYNKFTTMLSTIGAILIGNLAATYGFNIAGYITYFTNDINNSIIYRIALLVVSLGVLTITVLKSSEVKGKVKAEEIPLYTKVESKNKKSAAPIIVTLAIMMIVIIVGMTNWEELFGITLFSDMYTWITELEIAGYPLFANLIGAMYEMGSWTNYELALMISFAIIIIGLVYKIKFKDLLSSIVEGAKEMLPVAFYSILASVIFLMMNATSSGYTIFPTIANWLLGLADGFNVILFSIITLIGGFFYNDFPYFLGAIYDPVTNLYSSNTAVAGFISQSIYGLVQLLLPTSVLLIVGLKYFDIPYTEWFKKVFKAVLLILIAIVIILAIMALI